MLGIGYNGAERGLEDVQLNELGLEAVFDCEVSKSELKADWFKADKPIERSDKYNITSKNGRHSLTINDCQVDDVAIATPSSWTPSHPPPNSPSNVRQ